MECQKFDSEYIYQVGEVTFEEQVGNAQWFLESEDAQLGLLMVK